MLEEKMLAPDFTLPDQNGENVTLSSFRGKKVVLYFYPKDSTPGCTKEACSFRDNKLDIENYNAVIIGISKDSAKSHLNFIEKQNLNFILLSDENHTVMEQFGAWGEKVLYGKKSVGVIRSTFIIDEMGIIIKRWAKVNTATHGEDVKKFLSAL